MLDITIIPWIFTCRLASSNLQCYQLYCTSYRFSASFTSSRPTFACLLGRPCYMLDEHLDSSTCSSCITVLLGPVAIYPQPEISKTIYLLLHIFSARGVECFLLIFAISSLSLTLVDLPGGCRRIRSQRDPRHCLFRRYWPPASSPEIVDKQVEISALSELLSPRTATCSGTLSAPNGLFPNLSASLALSEDEISRIETADSGERRIHRCGFPIGRHCWRRQPNSRSGSFQVHAHGVLLDKDEIPGSQISSYDFVDNFIYH